MTLATRHSRRYGRKNQKPNPKNKKPNRNKGQTTEKMETFVTKWEGHEIIMHFIPPPPIPEYPKGAGKHYLPLPPVDPSEMVTTRMRCDFTDEEFFKFMNGEEIDGSDCSDYDINKDPDAFEIGGYGPVYRYEPYEMPVGTTTCIGRDASY